MNGRALVTGASRGIGRAIAIRLAAPGRELILHGRDEAALDRVAADVRARGATTRTIVADLASAAGATRVVEACGAAALSVLVNNAGHAVVRAVEAVTLDEWQRSLAVTVTAPFLLVQGLLPRLEGGGSIVNILSIAARRGFPGWSAYCAAKFALEGFSQSLREELRPRQIRVVNVYPAATNTELWTGVEGTWDRSRMMAPAEVADAVAFALDRPPGVGVDAIEIGDVSGAL